MSYKIQSRARENRQIVILTFASDSAFAFALLMASARTSLPDMITRQQKNMDSQTPYTKVNNSYKMDVGTLDNRHDKEQGYVLPICSHRS